MSHYYDKQGNPVYTVSKADGIGKRDTHIGDARKLKLCPSVTTIEKLIAKEQLNSWATDQILRAAYLLKSQEFGDPKQIDFIMRSFSGKELESRLRQYKCKYWGSVVKREGDKIRRTTAAHGTAIHSAIEHYFIHKEILPEYSAFVTPVIDKLESMFPGKLDTFIAERRFAHPLGFAGTIDLFSPELCVILDFKNKNKSREEWARVKGYDTHSFQLGSYRLGIAHSYPDMINATGYNIFISILEPGLVDSLKWEDEDLTRGAEMLKCLLAYWKLVNNYDSAFEVEHAKHNTKASETKEAPVNSEGKA